MFSWLRSQYSVSDWFAKAMLSSVLKAKTNSYESVESLIDLLHNQPAFTSPVDEVVAWGEDTWP